MKKLKGTKMGKRILSVVLAFGMVLALLPMAELGITVEAASNSDIQIHYSNGNKVVRGVLDTIEDLPQYSDSAWESKKVGTAKRPFLIVEIVPDEAMGHFGYLIGGCEPVDVEHMTTDDFMYNITNVNESCVVNHVSGAEFFPEEDQVQAKYNVGQNVSGWVRTEPAGKTLKGYYEVVEPGEGDFGLNDDKTAIEHKSSGGNMVWHTLNSFVKGYDSINFNQTVDSVSLVNVGDRIYTKRTETEYCVVNTNYHYYYNKEMFLIECLGLTEQEAAGYSVMVKTITPTELNSTPQWIDYADLFYVTPKTHNPTMIKMWVKNRRLDTHTTSLTPMASGDYDEPADGFGTQDLSWNVTKRLFDKLTRETNYAAMILDNSMYEKSGSETKSGVAYKAFNYNMDHISNFQEVGFRSNLYKLIIMTVSVNPNIVKNIFMPYMTASNPNDSNSKVKCTLQSGDAQEYWGEHYFFLLDEAKYNAAVASRTEAEKLNGAMSVYWSGGYLNYNGILNTTDWVNYNYLYNFHTERSFVQGRVYTFNGNNALTQDFHSGKVSANDSVFSEFAEYLATDEETRALWLSMTDKSGDLNTQSAPPSFAIRYILGLGKDYNKPITGTLKVLDVEPSVGVNTSDKYKPVWKLKDSYIRMMVPDFTGTISIDHMTMSSFVGRIDDLNSQYDLIYLGDDVDAYRQDANGNTDFVDNDLDGKIYFHNGDLMTGNQQDDDWGPAIRDVNFVDGTESGKARFPGNDITKVKTEDLVEYMKGGLPIVAEEELFSSSKMDACSNIWNFVGTYDVNSATNPLAAQGNGLLHTSQAKIIEAKIRANRISVDFLEWPVIYDEHNYLPSSGDQSVMNFKFKVDQIGRYSYTIYVDQDRNGKFEDDEWISRGDVGSLENTITAYTANGDAGGIVGLVQWRIVVYVSDNPRVRDSLEGCSAIKCKDSSMKNQINVLQITPNNGTNDDLTSTAYSSLYNNLDAFEITVTKITWDEFEKYFEGSDFKFDMGSAIVPGTNPSAVSLQKIRENGETHKAGKLEDYNMLVIGFKDGFGKDDLRNVNGAADYLYYYAALGRSILFTHDNTSFFNSLVYKGTAQSYKDQKVSGFTANAMLRDLMGMNRFGMESNQLQYITDATGAKRTYLSDSLKNFRSGTQFDFASWKMVGGTKVTDPYVQGYTIGALTRLGQKSTGSDKSIAGNVMPYKSFEFNWGNDETQLAVKLNEGQITQYPYNIDTNMSIGNTHAQYYMANLEDPELTVWYTLEYGPSYGKGGGGKIYSASPQDAANNYYIYSKGNVFYTGVGHSSTGSVMEKKLFVNTMIAAYRALAKPPAVVITNAEAAKINDTTYTLSVPRELNSDASGNLSEEDLGISTVRVKFKPKDSNFSNALRCRIYYTGETPDSTNIIQTVYDESGNAFTADPGDNYYLKRTLGDGTVKYLENGKEYYFDYEKSRMSGHPNLTFEIINDKLPEIGLTYLQLVPQPLFMLD